MASVRERERDFNPLRHLPWNSLVVAQYYHIQTALDPVSNWPLLILMAWAISKKSLDLELVITSPTEKAERYRLLFISGSSSKCPVG